MSSFGRVCALIPARCGSKGVRDKNIRVINGKPMLAYSVESALSSKLVDSVVVSTDSERYAEIARGYGAQIPFLRPADIASDSATDYDVFRHFLEWLKQNRHELPEAIVHLRPTHPFRKEGDIDAMVETLLANQDVDSVRSVSRARQTPYKMWVFERDSTMKPVATCDVEEAYNAPRQALPEVFMQNACIDVVRTSTLIEKQSMTGDVIAGYVMDYDFDIDTEDDFLKAELCLTASEKLKHGEKLKVVCDIDGVIARKTEDNDYSGATPLEKNIAAINRIHSQGHEVALHTARGYATGLDWEETTRSQMERWGVLYDGLIFGKPDADFYVDDKLISLDSLVELLA